MQNLQFDSQSRVDKAFCRHCD